MDVPVIEYCTKDKKRVIIPELINCDGVYNIPIYSNGRDFIGRAILTRHIRNLNGSPFLEDAIVLMDILIYDEKNRRQGAADDLMEFITHAFKKILTGISTFEGRQLCYKWGFKMERINNTNYLIYRKEELCTETKGKEGKDGHASGIQGCGTVDSQQAGNRNGSGAGDTGEVNKEFQSGSQEEKPKT